MRALQNCARSIQAKLLRHAQPLSPGDTVRAGRGAGSVKHQCHNPMRGEHVSVTGKVKFFNESKGYSYGELTSDLAALA
jgi:hypothetical protein